MSKTTYTANDAYNLWAGELSDIGTYSTQDRYDKHRRSEHIRYLASWLVDYGISHEEAKTLKNKVMLFLTTEEGRKGKGKHKNWKENTLADFDQIMAGTYMEKPKPSVANITVDPLRIQLDKQIVKWAQDKYDGNSLVISEAHRIASTFYFEYLEDTFH